MNIGFVVNDIRTEEPGYTTVRLAMAATNLGHKAWFMGAGDFAYDPDEKIRARATSVPKSKYKSSETFLGAERSRTRFHLHRLLLHSSSLDGWVVRAHPGQT